MMKTGIFGGTFNPPHRGHITAASYAAERLGLDRVWLIPAMQPPHKELPENSASPEERLEMLRLAAREDKRLFVSDMEIKRGGVSYTADTIGEIRRLHPDAEIWLLVGDDMLASIEQWRRFEYILKNARLCAMSRYENPCLGDIDERLKREYGAEIARLQNNVLEISSTELREMLKNRAGREQLDPEVYAYIIRRRLYGAKADLQWLREQSYARLNPKRVPHVKGCEEEAARLARRWGADEDAAREAGILHDVTKKLELGEQLILCEKYDIMIDSVEKKTLKLLHSRTGAAVAENDFGASPEVCGAIRWHTTGRAGMTLLEKIIYMADYIEPTREFEEVHELRRLAYEDLDRSLLRGLELTAEQLLAMGEAPYYRTLEAIEYLKKGDQSV